MGLSKSQQGYALVSLYLSLYTQRHGHKPINFNSYKHQHGFQRMAEDLGYSHARVIIEYYFATPKTSHPVEYLLYNYEKLNIAMIESEQDEQERIRLRAESKIRVDEWKREHGI